MSVRSAPLSALADLHGLLDERTVEILDRRRTAPATRRRGWLVRRALLAADLVGLTVAFLIAQEVYDAGVGGSHNLDRSGEMLLFALSLPGWVLAAKLCGLYEKDEERTDHSTIDDFSGVFHVVTVCTFLLYAASQLTNWAHPEFNKLLLFWLLATLSVSLARASARTMCHRSVHYLQNTVIVGAGEVGQSVAKKLLKHPEYGINLVGFIDSAPKERSDALEHLTVLGHPERLLEIVKLLDVERVIFAFSNQSESATLELLRELRTTDTQIDIVPRLFDCLGPSIGIHAIEGMPLVSLPPARLPWSSLVIKRALDLVLATVGLIVLAPFFAVIALLLKQDSRGPIFYRHARVGKRRQTFKLFKFRTMRIEACRGPEYGGDSAEEAFSLLMSDPSRRSEFETSYKLRDDPRVTRVGKFLRRTSMDELPQLLNVLAGDISLVGPRALTEDELDRYYGPAADALLAGRPGITGYWQINGRSDLEYTDRVRLDLAYVAGWSLALDLSILARTMRVVFARRSAY